MPGTTEVQEECMGVAGPFLQQPHRGWNPLVLEIQNVPLPSVFKSTLETHPFHQAIGGQLLLLLYGCSYIPANGSLQSK